MIKELRITSVDNPFDPFDEWDQWLLFDNRKGYHTCERLARVTMISDQLSDEEVLDSVERGVDQLMTIGCIDKEGNVVEYKRVYKEIDTMNHSEDDNNSKDNKELNKQLNHSTEEPESIDLTDINIE